MAVLLESVAVALIEDALYPFKRRDRMIALVQFPIPFARVEGSLPRRTAYARVRY
jgi:hypothetical protein